jgi:hypothetical protein
VTKRRSSPHFRKRKRVEDNEVPGPFRAFLLTPLRHWHTFNPFSSPWSFAMRTFLCLVLLSALIGCAKSDARSLDVERAPELAVQSASEPLPMPPKEQIGDEESHGDAVTIQIIEVTNPDGSKRRVGKEITPGVNNPRLFEINRLP